MTRNEQAYNDFAASLSTLSESGNLRVIPEVDRPEALVDFTSNDYMGIAEDAALRDEFLDTLPRERMLLTSSASRLLAGKQDAYTRLERRLEELYSRPTLLYNSGYHVNTGVISALADSRTVILADRLIHASMIDGMQLAKAQFARFRHNDYPHLETLLQKYSATDCRTIIVLVESVYSMDGDRADIEQLIALKRRYPKMLLCVDEAHAFACEGPGGLGLVAASSAPEEVDIVIVTLGKGAASQGAFVVCDETLKRYLINRSRSLIFSTAIPPISAEWTLFAVNRLLDMDDRRRHLHALAERVANAFAEMGCEAQSHTAIQPFIVGNPRRTVELSEALALDGVKVMPIRTPTVPAGTDRLRISLSAARTDDQITLLINSLRSRYEANLHNI